MKKQYKLAILKSGMTAVALSTLMLGGCATSTLLEKDTGTYSKTTQTNLVEDRVVAFGKPAQTGGHLPSDSVVIAGEKNSYILTQGGAKFSTLITRLDPKHIQINNELRFVSALNDGRFSGKLNLAYVKLRKEIGQAELNFFIEQGARECSTSSDQRMDAQRFCFDLNLVGVVYPVANNINQLQGNMQRLSKPYHVTIYTTKTEQHSRATAKSGLQKLMLFPFAVALDVVTLPIQATYKIFE